MTRKLALVGLLLVLIALGVRYAVRDDSGARLTSSERAAPTAAGPSATEVPPEATALEISSEAATVPDRSALDSAPPKRARTQGDPPSAKAQGAFRGRVVNDVGNPVDRFSIEARAPSTVDEPFWSSGESHRREFKSSDGTFQFDGLPAREWQLVAQGDGDTRSAPVTATAPSEGADLVLVLPRSATVTGIVRTPDGPPVPDAEVFLRYPGERDPIRDLGDDPKPRSRTETDGRFRIEHVQPGAFQVFAMHPDHSESDRLDVSVLPGEVADVEIRLGQGGRIEGRVDPSLGEVSGREIGLFSFNGAIGWRNAATDATGSFVIEHVIPQDYIVELRPAGYPKPPSGGSESGIRKRISVAAGKTTEVVFAASSSSIRLFGMITSGGEPAPGLRIRAYPRGEGVQIQGKEDTGVDGRYELTLDRAGEYRFLVTGNYGSSADFERTVPEQEAVELHFEVPSGGISGQVLSPDGKPLGRVPVTLLRAPSEGESSQESFWERYDRTRTEEDGTFSFGLLVPGSYTLRTADGAQRGRPPPRVPFGRVVLADIEVRTDRIDGVAIRLLPEGRIAGRVVDREGRPVAEAVIRVVDSHGLPLSAYWEAETDVTGSFLAHSIAPGSYTVVARHGERQSTSPVVLVEAGKTSDATVELR